MAVVTYAPCCPCPEGGGGGPITVTPCSGTLDSTLARQSGAGVINIPAGRRSVTLTVINGDTDVSISGGGAITATAGTVLSWGVDGCGETLGDTFAFTGSDPGDVFLVNTTLP